MDLAIISTFMHRRLLKPRTKPALMVPTSHHGIIIIMRNIRPINCVRSLLLQTWGIFPRCTYGQAQWRIPIIANGCSASGL